MREYSCDVLIVGASSAGLGAANALSVSGKKVICVDCKSAVGAEIHCAEGVGKYFVDLMPIKIPREYLEWPVDGIAFYYKSYGLVQKSKLWKGYSVNRKKLEAYFFSLCAKKVEFIFDSRLINLKCEPNNVVKKLIFEDSVGQFSVLPKRVIAADGVDSKVAELMQLPFGEKVFGEIINFEIISKNLKNVELEQIYLGDFAPNGYGFIFPKSENIANVGVGGINPKKDMNKLFAKFLELSSVKSQLSGMTILKDKSKRSAFGERLLKWNYGNVLFCGDAANHNYKPFVEGFLPSFISGWVAGKYSLSKNISAKIYAQKIFEALPGFKENKILQKSMQKVFTLPNTEKASILFLLSSGLIDPLQVKSLSLRKVNVLLEKKHLKEFD